MLLLLKLSPVGTKYSFHQLLLDYPTARLPLNPHKPYSKAAKLVKLLRLRSYDLKLYGTQATEFTVAAPVTSNPDIDDQSFRLDPIPRTASISQIVGQTRTYNKTFLRTSIFLSPGLLVVGSKQATMTEGETGNYSANLHSSYLSTEEAKLESWTSTP